MDFDEKVNILLIDDSPENLAVLESILEELGQNIVKFRSGEEALEFLFANESGVILVDGRMPAMDDFETARIIRRGDNTRLTPIIFLIARETDHAYVVQGYSLGAVDFVSRPIVPEILRARVNVFADLVRTRRKLEKSCEREQQETELGLLRRLSASSPAYVTGQLYGVMPFRLTAPELFNETVGIYLELLDLTMEQHAYRVDHDISGRTGALADRLGSFNAGPQDVVDLHLAAAGSRTRGASPEKAQGYALEGRLLALELMGHLVDYYRRCVNLAGLSLEKEVPL
jgi:CheY-like chemotaxis protein